jgi:hypothetical protein
MIGVENYGRRIVSKWDIWTCAKCGWMNSHERKTCSKCEVKNNLNFKKDGLYRKCEKCLERKHTSKFRITAVGQVVFKNCKECRKNKEDNKL